MLPALPPVLKEPWEPSPSGIPGAGSQALALQEERAHWITAEDSLSSASALQHGGWRKNCELWETSCFLLPPSPVPLWKTGAAFCTQPYTILSFIFSSPHPIATFQGPISAPALPHLSWVPGSVPKQIFPILPPSPLPNYPISCTGIYQSS